MLHDSCEHHPVGRKCKERSVLMLTPEHGPYSSVESGMHQRYVVPITREHGSNNQI